MKRYLGAGLVYDEEANEMHFYVVDALKEFGWPDLPENRKRAEELVRKAIAEKWPELKCTEVD